MGYSLSVKFNTKEDKDLMKLFWENNEPLFKELSKTQKYGNDQIYLGEGEEISYAPRVKNILGFNVHTTTFNMWSLVSWMAFNFNVQDKKQRYFVYYDTERHYLTQESNNKKDLLVDEKGILVPQENDLKFNFYEIDFQKQHEVMKKINEALIQFKQEHTKKPTMKF